MTDFLKLKDIANKSLKACSTDIGYTAGVHHFVDLWARDSLFACLGDINSDETKTTIDTFLRYQKCDGSIPYRVRRSKASFKKYFGKPELLKHPMPDFHSFQSFGFVPDGGLMTIIIAKEYIKESNDVRYKKEILPKLLNAIDFYIDEYKEKLITEWLLCEWADSVLKVGKILYTNVLYLRALMSIIELTDNPKYKEIYENVLNEFNKTFWNGKYYSDWFDYKRQDYLSVHSNCLAILFGLVPDEKARIIKKEIEPNCLMKVGMKSNYPKYPFWRIPILNYFIHLQDYHNGILWLQPWITYIGACIKLGDKTTAKRELEKLSKIIERDNVVYENYEKNFLHLNRIFYKSECPFAWSSGLILWVLDML